MIQTANDGCGLRVLCRWLGETRRDWSREPLPEEPAAGDTVREDYRDVIARENLRSLGHAVPTSRQEIEGIERLDRDNAPRSWGWRP